MAEIDEVNNTIFAEREHEVFVLSRREDMSSYEIAEEMNIRPATVRQYLGNIQIKINKAYRTIEKVEEFENQ